MERNYKDDLFANADEKYKKFNSALIPTVSPESVIGVRVPTLRKIAKTLYLSGDYEKFLHSLPHEYFEENCLHAYIVEQIKDFDTCLKETEKFLPYVDNWAVCDTFSPKIFGKFPQKLLQKIDVWLNSAHVYTVRFGVCMLMKYFLDDDFKAEFLEKVVRINAQDYYLKMVIAWYFATALAKQYNATIPYLENRVLPLWIHNKTIQKATESYRIDKNTKEYLKSLKMKKFYLQDL